jgi:hypothetical protein
MIALATISRGSKEKLRFVKSSRPDIQFSKGEFSESLFPIFFIWIWQNNSPCSYLLVPEVTLL